MEIDLNELERAALEATPGPWRVQHPNAGSRGFEVADDAGLEQICADVTEERAAYIAAANPATVLELIRRLRAAEAGAAANLSALNLKAGDMLVVRTDADLHQNYDQFAVFANALRGMLPEGVQAMVLPDEVEVSAMPEDAMRRAGWVRAEK